MSNLKQAISFIVLIFAFNIATYSQATDLFFSEYHEGSGFDKYVEIFNGTGSAVDLSQYRVNLHQNDGADVDQFVDLPAVMLADGEVYVISRSDASQAILDETDLENSSVINFNGDDRVSLEKGGVIIDIIGEQGNRTDWSFNGGGTQNSGIRRNSDVTAGNNNDWLNTYQSQWTGFSQDDFSDLGMHTFNGGNQTGATDLFFSEYHEDGNDKYVEIFNGTGSAVDLSNYRIDIEQNADPTIDQSVVLSGTLADGDVYVICNTSSVQAIKDEADLENNSIAIFNGDDRIRLVDNNTDALIDIIGESGVRDNWGVLESAGIRRNSDITMGNSGDWTNTYQSEWTTFAADDFSDLGMHTFNPQGSGGGGGGGNNPPQPSLVATDLFISEYGEGGSNDNYIELFNGTGSQIDLSEYELRISDIDFDNGNVESFPLTGTLDNLQLVVIANGSASDSELRDAGTPYTVVELAGFDFDGYDAVGLFKNGTLIDGFGRFDDINRDIDRIETQSSVVVRKPNIASPNPLLDPNNGQGSNYGTSESNSEWEGYYFEYYGNIGVHVFDGIEYPAGDRRQIYMEYFDDNTLNPWTSFDNGSRNGWVIGSFFSSLYAEVNNYESFDEAAEDWLISFPIDTRRFENSEVEFIFQRAFARADLVDVFVSTDYDGVSNPNDFTWVRANSVYDPGSPNFFWNATSFSLDQYKGREVYIAFQYVESDFQDEDGTVERFAFDNFHLVTDEVQNVPATNIQVTEVRPSSPFQNINFELLIEVTDANGIPMPVTQDTDLNIQLTDGSGNLSGDVTVQIKQDEFSAVATLQYDQVGMIDIEVSDPANNLASATQEDIEILVAPDQVVATSFYSKGFVNLPHSPFEFEVLNSNGNLDTRFDDIPADLVVYRNGQPVNFFQTRTVNGRIIFDDVVFQNTGNLEVRCNISNGSLVSDFIPVNILLQPNSNFIHVPKYMVTHSGDDGFGERLPVWGHIEITGLHPNTTYRFYTSAVSTDFTGDQEGLNNASTLANTLLMDANGDEAEFWYIDESGDYELDWEATGCSDQLPVNRKLYSTFVSDDAGNIILPVNLITDGNNFFVPDDDLRFWWAVTLGDENGTFLTRYQSGSNQFTTAKTLSPSGSVNNRHRATGIYDMQSNLEPLSVILFYNQNNEIVSSAMVQGDGARVQTLGGFDPQTCEVDFFFPHQGPDFFRDVDGYFSNDGSIAFDEIDGGWASFLPNFNSEFSSTVSEDTRVTRIAYFDFEGNYLDEISNQTGVWDGISTNNPNGGLDNPINFRTPVLKLTSFTGINEFCNTEEAHIISWEAGAVETVDVWVDVYDDQGFLIREDQIFNDVPAVNNPEEDPRAGSVEWIIDRGVYSEQNIQIRLTTGDNQLTETTEIFRLYDAPSFQTTSISVVKCEGEDNTFVCTATGSEVQYQWYKDGEILEGETDQGLLIEDLEHSASGVYNCLVTNQNSTICGDYFTEDMVLYVARGTEITVQPQSTGAVQGGRALFRFDSHSTGLPPTYNIDIQWFRDGVALEEDDRITGVNSNYMTIKDVNADDFSTAPDYYAVATGKCGSATTTIVSLVEARFSIDQQPMDNDACEGGAFELYVDVTTSEEDKLMYQWFRNDIPVSNGPNVAGAQSATLSVVNANTTNDGSYYCNIMLEDQDYTVSSNPAEVTLTSAPTITTDLAGTYDVKVGDPLDLNIVADGSGTLTYQWIKDGDLISGETADTYSIASLTEEDSGIYSVTVANDCGAVSSNSATVTVTNSGEINLSVIKRTENGYELHAPAPNPVSSISNVKFVLPSKDQVTLKLLSPTGAEITLIEGQYFGSGENNFELNADILNLANGAYTLYFEASNARLTQQIVISK